MATAIPAMIITSRFDNTQRDREGLSLLLALKRSSFLGALPGLDSYTRTGSHSIPWAHTASPGTGSHSIPRIRSHTIHWDWTAWHPLELGQMPSTGTGPHSIHWDWITHPSINHLRKWSYQDCLRPRFSQLQLTPVCTKSF